MTTKSLADIYGGEGAEASVVPESVYDVTVKDARGIIAKEGKSGIGNIFADLEVLNGPSAGELVEVTIFVPDPGNRNALFHFSNKTAAFKGDIKAALASSGDATPQGILKAITAAMIGKSVSAELGVQTEGTFAGKNELKKTTALAAGVAAAPVAAPVVEAEAAPVVVAPAVVETAEAGVPDLPF
jgi:hypothetical protein